ncbi:aldose reductase YakC [Calocera cornea HHB12733]|uniref:Aldose reductase YakC n=1 Tax=Calocera cornea HHB12733 TaxID=1353952 RepID=A0A165CUM7_9BASI|nr:aldose reductase YakC [Calocera cornea HHB12733]
MHNNIPCISASTTRRTEATPPMSLPTRLLAGRQVPIPGFGCMGISAYYAPSLKSEQHYQSVLRAAYDLGARHWDTANVYGEHGLGENERLIGRAIMELEIPREDIFLATKFGISYEDGVLRARGSPEYVRACLAQSLEALQTPYVDLYYVHRVDPDTPIEVTVNAMQQLKEEGKIRGIGLSECSAETLRKAAKVVTVDAVQVEYSLFETTPETNGLLATCKELNVPLVAYSPLGRGFLSGRFRTRADLPSIDSRLGLPRFSEENFPKNLVLVDHVNRLAQKKGCTAGQLALAWIHAQWERTIAIPGTTRVEALKENVESGKVVLSPEELTEIREVLDSFKPVGNRYDEWMTALEDQSA